MSPLHFNRSISIHSLVKRETKRHATTHPGGGDFNPLPRKEGDCQHLFWHAFPFYFNPLPRKEGDKDGFLLFR